MTNHLSKTILTCKTIQLCEIKTIKLKTSTKLWWLISNKKISQNFIERREKQYKRFLKNFSKFSQNHEIWSEWEKTKFYLTEISRPLDRNFPSRLYRRKCIFFYFVPVSCCEFEINRRLLKSSDQFFSDSFLKEIVKIYGIEF